MNSDLESENVVPVELIEKIKRIEEENEILRRENLLFSRYLLRMNSTKTVESFEEYEDENDIIQIKLPDVLRRFSLKKPSKETSRWTKVSINWHDYFYAPRLLRIEQERLSIAAYELEQARLDRERMQANAIITLENLDILYQTIESDALVQRTLNHDIERRVNKYFASIGEEEFHSSDATLPAERIISRIHKHINSRTNLIGYLRVNTSRLDTRMGEMNSRMCFLDELNHKMDKVDIDLMNARIIDNIKTYENLGRIYRIEKLVQYSSFHRLQKWKQILNEQEMNTNSIKNQSEFLQNHLEKLLMEIDYITQEYQVLLHENKIFKDRINCIFKVPTILDYAHIIEQTKVLQHEIKIWTKRVHMVEMLLLQLQRQTQLPKILPPLQLPVIDQHLSIKSSTG